ncbi:MAG: long-chain fatty acid--CoA ligase, partial [Flavobacteriales bacterium]|nr:long-chain fatty acid--CoA ligase [Flavobacteriales bacterium]
FIEQVMVIGENRKFPSALIVPSFGFLKDYCALKGIPFTSNAQVVIEPRIVERINKEVDKVNATLGHWEQVKRVALLDTEWSIDTGEMTPKLSLRRKPILAKYASQVEAIYGGA